MINAQNFFEEGDGSYYADKYIGKSTASGEPYNDKIFTAAHKTLPFGTKVIVTNKVNGKSVIVRVNDRGPFAEGRIIDLSKAAAQYIDMVQTGTVPVKLRIMDEAMASTTTASTPATTTVPVYTPPTTTTATPVTTKPVEDKVVTSPSTNNFNTIPVINSSTIGANFAVQLGSFNKMENASFQANNFRSYSFGNELKIYETWKNGKRLYKILVGPFYEREEAARRASDIKATYSLDCFVFKVR